MIASTTGTGSISILNYGFILVNVPVLFFSESLVTSLFPHFTKNAANGELEKVKNAVIKAVHVLLFILAPVMLLFLLFSHEIIYYLFERGTFTADATKAVSSVLFFFALGLIPQGLLALVASTLNAIKKVKQRMYLFLCLLLSNIVLSLFFVHFFSYTGIAIAMSIGYWIVVMLGMWYLLTMLEFDAYKRLFIEGLKVLIASGISALIVSLLYAQVVSTSAIPMGTFMHFFLLVGFIISLLIFYCLLMKAVQAEGLKAIMHALRKQYEK